MTASDYPKRMSRDHRFSAVTYHQPCQSSSLGDAPTTKSITTKPADLTKLSEGNKGTFPISRVYDLIDGGRSVLAHGPRDMPVWGQRFKEQLLAQLPRDSKLGPEEIEALIRSRILSLVEYISS